MHTQTTSETTRYAVTGINARKQAWTWIRLGERLNSWGNSGNTREFLKAWASNQPAITRHINLDEIYQLVEKSLGNNLIKYQWNKTVNLDTKTAEDNETYKGKQLKSRTSGQHELRLTE